MSLLMCMHTAVGLAIHVFVSRACVFQVPHRIVSLLVFLLFYIFTVTFRLLDLVIVM